MTPNRIDQRFAALKARGARAFVAYLTAGDPNPAATPPIIEAIAGAGADIVELGVPFSDPIADGPVIQQACQRALAQGASLPVVLDILRQTRARTDVPIVLFTYFNPVLRYGPKRFFADAAAAGADGILLLDLPPEEAGAERAEANAAGLAWICLIAPTTPAERVPILAANSSGFVYYVSREGVTGVRDSLAASLGERLRFLRAHSNLPVCVGFGISTAEHVRAAARDADGVVIGSAIVRQIELHGADPSLPARVADFVRPLAEAAHHPKA